jgi:DNA-binding MarR family transcriptional regulator
MSEEWVPMSEAARRLKVRVSKISRLASKGRIETRENPLDERVRLVNFTELRALFDKYGPKLDEDDDET